MTATGENMVNFQSNSVIMGESGTEFPLCPDPIKRLGEESPVPNTNLPDGLCLCGCGKPVKLAPRTDRLKGWIKGQPQKFIAGHAGTFSQWGRKDRIMYEVNSETGCWEWQGSLRTGYGVIHDGGKRIVAHRFFYENKFGKVADGMCLDHLCRNRRCVNPDHLDVTTLGENVRRGDSAKLSRNDVAKIKQMRASGMTYREISEHFPVGQIEIGRIIRGEKWQ